MTIFYFTSTGNCLHVAKSIGGTIYSIPQLMKERRFSFQDDVIGLVCPCYGFGMPHIVSEFLKQVQWEAEYSFAISTYGNMTGAVLQNLERFAAKQGLTFDYMNTLLMVDNYLPNYKVEDQLAALPQKNTEANLAQIIADIRAGKKNKPAATVSERLFTAAIQAGAKAFMNGKNAQSYLVNSNCTQCGVCTKICPTGNIEIKDSVVFLERCEGCLGCVHLCPQNAIHLKNEKSTARFRNEHVALHEIIEANNQHL